MPLAQLIDSFRQYTGFDRKIYDTTEAAFTALLSQKNDGDKVYIVGSLYLVGEVKALVRSLEHD